MIDEFDHVPPTDADQAQKAEVVTVARARFLLRTLGFKCALGWIRTRVASPEVAAMWLLGARPR